MSSKESQALCLRRASEVKCMTLGIRASETLAASIYSALYRRTIFEKIEIHIPVANDALVIYT